MADFYPLKVKEKHLLTPESVAISFEIPDELKEKFRFTPGQFVMLEKEINGDKLRRYYSIFSDVDNADIQLGIKLKGQDGFADFALRQLKVGDVLQVSAPMDDVPFQLDAAYKKNYLAITIGSGITPFYSIIQSIIKHRLDSRMVLVYGNHTPKLTMFYKELQDLQSKYPQNLKVYFVFSESTKGDYKNRIDEDILEDILRKEKQNFDAVYMIGPDDLKKKAAKVLLEHSFNSDILHYRVYS